jgi:membrane protein implicated in regulation of membrane protease activity
MGIKIWWIWMAIAAFFIITEIFTMGFFLLWFGVGAAVAGVLALCGLGIGWQLASFVVVSGVLFVVSRGFAEKFTKKQPPGIGADRFLHKKGVVIEEIDNLKNTGRVRIGKDEWRADSDTDEVIPEGKIIEVTSVDGTHLVVKLSKEGE